MGSRMRLRLPRIAVIVHRRASDPIQPWQASPNPADAVKDVVGNSDVRAHANTAMAVENSDIVGKRNEEHVHADDHTCKKKQTLLFWGESLMHLARDNISWRLDKLDA